MDKGIERLSEVSRPLEEAAAQVCDVVTRVCHAIDRSNGHLKKALLPEVYEKEKRISH